MKNNDLKKCRNNIYADASLKNRTFEKIENYKDKTNKNTLKNVILAAACMILIAAITFVSLNVWRNDNNYINRITGISNLQKTKAAMNSNKTDFSTGTNPISSFKTTAPGSSAIIGEDAVNVDFYYDFGSNATALTYITITISRANMLRDTQYYMKKYNKYIEIENLWYEGKKICVDLTGNMAAVMDGGSTIGSMTTAILKRTFSSYPDVDEMEFLIGGVRNREGEHFSFVGPFIVADMTYGEYPEIIAPKSALPIASAEQ